MKRIIGFVLLSLILLSCVPFSAFAANPEIFCGVVVFDNNGADTITIDNVDFKATTSYEFKAIIKVSDSTNTYSQIQLNGKKIADLIDGENVDPLKALNKVGDD